MKRGPLLAETSRSDSPGSLCLSVRYWEKQTLRGIRPDKRVLNVRFSQKQPLAVSGECPVYPETSRSGDSIWH